MKSCFMFGHADCPDSMLSRIKQAVVNCYSKGVTAFYVGSRGRFDGLATREIYWSMLKSGKKVAALKMWQKIISAVLVIVLIIGAVWYFSQEQKDCCLCSCARFHAPCLIDLESGEMIELGLYFPHKTKVAELADTQPETSTFSFVRLGNITGTKLTGSRIIEMDVPASEVSAMPALCRKCRKQMDGFIGRYVLADLYDPEEKILIPVHANLSLVLRCYEITATEKEPGVLNVVIQGTLE